MAQFCPYQRRFDGSNGRVHLAESLTLNGALGVNGNLSLIAGQVYPTTGSSFAITSTETDGTITFGRSSDALPVTPYSAGGNLTVQAANIVQGFRWHKMLDYCQRIVREIAFLIEAPALNGQSQDLMGLVEKPEILT